MKKNLWLSLILVLQLPFFSSVSAQGRFNTYLFAGLNMCQIDGDAASSYSHPGPRVGIGISFPVTKDLNSPWSMVVEVAYTNKGSHIAEYDRDLSITYIELGLMMAYHTLDDRLRLAIGLAPAISVSTSVTNSGAVDLVSEDDFSDMDWLPLTASVCYRFTKHLSIEGRFQYSALSITKPNVSGTYFISRSNKGCFHNLIGIGLSYSL